ncbi:FAD-dependent monooxygenase [Nocardia arthritidis]|uniref:Flavin-dependent oxidoreductase n=1 Tax=Nocardia arthritidis TaxID=228602 RepID=A0A6G9Y741_9NOCA|nr:FAD-dependent monooxygenase [Nocardia arthritidis]QIS09032.1 flavin-dependent oxidoreductase [Nocardia arthritidis]
MGEQNIVIAGAGIGGLTAALSLHAKGIEATVIESARTIAPLGVGINVQSEAVAVLTELGLGDRLAATGVATAEYIYCDRHGNRILTESRGRAAGNAAPQYSIHRGELQLLLLDAVRERLGADAVRTGIQLTDLRQDGQSVRITTLDRNSGGHETEMADLLIGADGLHSAVRARLHPDRMRLHWSGLRMWRGMAEADSFLTGQSMVIVNGGPTRLVAYPISSRTAPGRSLVNWVALVTVSEPGWLDDDAGFNRAASADDALPHVADFALGWLDVPGLVAASTDILEYPMVDRDPLPWWGRGRVTLLGDAAHPMYPVGALGGTQAILDASVLADELAVGDDPADALMRYENRRREPTSTIVLANRQYDLQERTGADAVRIIDDYQKTIATASRP